VRIGITGGTGFVGWNIARALVGDGHEVILIACRCNQAATTFLEMP
jgi:nucleoside-diphosphate-sugar epimerase